MGHEEAAAAVAEYHKQVAHEEGKTFSAILGRTTICCVKCKALKGSKEWEYDCRGASDGQKEKVHA